MKILLENMRNISAESKGMPIMVNEIPIGYIENVTETEIYCNIWDNCVEYATESGIFTKIEFVTRDKYYRCK